MGTFGRSCSAQSEHTCRRNEVPRQVRLSWPARACFLALGVRVEVVGQVGGQRMERLLARPRSHSSSISHRGAVRPVAAQHRPRRAQARRPCPAAGAGRRSGGTSTVQIVFEAPRASSSPHSASRRALVRAAAAESVRERTCASHSIFLVRAHDRPCVPRRRAASCSTRVRSFSRRRRSAAFLLRSIPSAVSK